MGEKYKMTLDLSDYEEISYNEYIKLTSGIEWITSYEVDRYGTPTKYYFRKKQPKQEFPIELQSEYIRMKIYQDGSMYVEDNRLGKNAISINPENFDKFEEAIKIAKKVRDNGKL